MKSQPMFALSAALAFVALGNPVAHAQQEIDPDHFDSPNTKSTPQPGAAVNKLGVIRYHGTFSLPYSALCNGRKLAAGEYSISLHSNGQVGHATFIHDGHAIEMASVVQTKAPNQRDEVVVFDNARNGRTLSLARVSGVAFVFDPKHPAVSSTNNLGPHTERLPLMVAHNIRSQLPLQVAHKP